MSLLLGRRDVSFTFSHRTVMYEGDLVFQHFLAHTTSVFAFYTPIVLLLYRCIDCPSRLLNFLARACCEHSHDARSGWAVNWKKAFSKGSLTKTMCPKHWVLLGCNVSFLPDLKSFPKSSGAREVKPATHSYMLPNPGSPSISMAMLPRSKTLPRCGTRYAC